MKKTNKFLLIALGSIVLSLIIVSAVLASSTVGTNLSTTGTFTATGLSTLTGGASVSANFELTGNYRQGINAGNVTDTSLEVGGTASVSGALTFGGLITASNTGSHSFSGGLEVTKGVHATTGLSTAGSLTGTGATLLYGSFTFGDNGDTGSIDTSDWDISTTGALTGISGITTDGVYTQSGTSANTFTGLSSFSGGVSVSTNFELTGNTRQGINAGNVTNSSLEVGGTASVSSIIIGTGTSITKHLSSTFSVNFATLTQKCLDSSGQTVTGAALGDTVVPSANIAMPASFSLQAFVSATDTVVFRWCEFGLPLSDPDGGGATYRVDVWQH